MDTRVQRNFNGQRKLYASFIISYNNQGDCVSNKGMLWCYKAFCRGIDSTQKKKLIGLSPHANYTDRAAAAGRRS